MSECNKPRRNSGERGVTLIEVLLVLGIATAFIAGGLALYDQAQTASEDQRVVRHIWGAIAGARDLRGEANPYGQISREAVGLSNFRAAERHWGLTQMNLGGALDDGMNAGGMPANFFRVQLRGITPEHCNVVVNNFQNDFAVVVATIALRPGVAIPGSGPTMPFEPGVPGLWAGTAGCNLMVGNPTTDSVYIFGR